MAENIIITKNNFSDKIKIILKNQSDSFRIDKQTNSHKIHIDNQQNMLAWLTEWNQFSLIVLIIYH